MIFAQVPSRRRATFASLCCQLGRRAPGRPRCLATCLHICPSCLNPVSSRCFGSTRHWTLLAMPVPCLWHLPQGHRALHLTMHHESQSRHHSEPLSRVWPAAASIIVPFALPAEVSHWSETFQ